MRVMDHQELDMVLEGKTHPIVVFNKPFTKGANEFSSANHGLFILKDFLESMFYFLGIRRSMARVTKLIRQTKIVIYTASELRKEA